jgi:hypothetical protein
MLGYYRGESIASIGRRLGMTCLSVSKWVAKALAGRADGGAERQLPPPQGTNHRRRCQGLGVLQTEGSGLRSRSLEPASAGTAGPRACRGGRFSCVIASGQSDRASNSGGPATASGKVKYYLERRDPDFEVGMRRVLIVYQDVALQNARRAAGETASNIITVSVDEKPGVQAIGNTAPDLPPVPGKHPAIGRDHEYERLGTCSILVALDLQDGQVTALVEDRHRLFHWPTSRPRCEVSAGMHHQNHNGPSFRSHIPRDAGIPIEAPQPLSVRPHTKTRLLAEYR